MQYHFSFRQVLIFCTGLIWLLLLSACSENAVVFAPTPLPPDTSPLRFQHPGGAFTVDIPREWTSYVQNSATLASAHFTPPGMGSPVVNVIVIKWDVEPTSINLLDVVNAYEQELRPNLSRYTEQDRQIMSDGSWRITGYEVLPGGSRIELNTFIEQNDSTIAVTEVRLTQPDLLPTIENIVNSVIINPQANLQATSLSTLTNWSGAPLEFSSVTTWSTQQGVYFITGEVVNRGTETVSSVPIRAVLLAETEGNSLEAIDVVMGYGIRPGEFAPFSLRFGQGAPADAFTFDLSLGNDIWQQNRNPIGEIAGGEQLSWSTELTQTPEGQLIISGTVTHSGSQNVYDPVATVSIFDGERNVIAAGFVPVVEGSFSPGETNTFSLRVPEMGGTPVDYYVNVQAKTTPQ